MIDITGIVLGIIMIVAVFAVRKIWPWLQTIVPVGILQFIAKSAVYAVEVLYKNGEGKEKLTAAIEKVDEFLNKYHLDFNSEQVLAAIEGEWLKLNIAQLNSGMKYTELTEIQESQMDIEDEVIEEITRQILDKVKEEIAIEFDKIE